MPKQKRQLTPGRLKLAKAYAQTGNLALAAREAGMHEQSGRVALHDPGVQAMVKREQLHMLVTVGVPVAVKALVEIAGDVNERGSTRVMASKEILAIAKVSPDAITEEALDGATIAELQALLERTKDHNARHAQVIDAEVIEPGALD
jgi:phage terminase small subunit